MKPTKVFCPQCRTWWVYSFNRKLACGEIVQPTKVMRLTCQACHEKIKFQATDSDDRALNKADRMDNDE